MNKSPLLRTSIVFLVIPLIPLGYLERVYLNLICLLRWIKISTICTPFVEIMPKTLKDKKKSIAPTFLILKTDLVWVKMENGEWTLRVQHSSLKPDECSLTMPAMDGHLILSIHFKVLKSVSYTCGFPPSRKHLIKAWHCMQLGI